MHHRAAAMFADDPPDQGVIRDLTFIERHPGGHRATPAGGQIVHHHRLATIVQQRQHGVAADITGTAGDQDGMVS